MPPDLYSVPPNILVAATIFSEATKKNINAFDKDANAIASVIQNRTLKPERFGEGVHGVILKPQQFTGVGGKEFNKALSGNLTEEEQEYFNSALAVSRKLSLGELEDVTGGADHYVNLKLSKPSWSKSYPKTYETKDHTFFKEVPLDANGKPLTKKKPTLTQRVKKAGELSAFEQAFADARKAGKKTFKFEGKSFTTKMK